MIRRGVADSRALSPRGTIEREIDATTLARAVAALEQAVAHRVERLHAYDDYCDSVHGDPGIRPLPVLRATLGNGVWHYLDPASGRPLLRVSRANRLQRWLYNGLHSLDFPPLLSRPRLREALIVAFCGAGLALSVTGVWLGLRRVRRSVRIRS